MPPAAGSAIRFVHALSNLYSRPPTDRRRAFFQLLGKETKDIDLTVDDMNGVAFARKLQSFARQQKRNQTQCLLPRCRSLMRARRSTLQQRGRHQGEP